jgi:hypothetical protein
MSLIHVDRKRICPQILSVVYKRADPADFSMESDDCVTGLACENATCIKCVISCERMIVTTVHTI